MSAEDPRSSFQFANAAGFPTLPNVSQAGLLIGVGTALPNALLSYGSGASVRDTFGEARLTEIAEEHFALDTARHPIAIVGTAATTAGILHLVLTGVTGTSVASADGTIKPLGDWPGVQVDAATGGTIGTAGILLDVSLDYGLTPTRIDLGTATFVEFDGYGIKIQLAAGTLNAGDRITGWTEPPRWTTGELQTAMATALDTAAQFGLVCIAEPLLASDGSTISGFLDDCEAAIPRRFPHLIGSKRRQYRAATQATITGSFANANPDTLTRATGSFVTDGFKAGMRVTITGADDVGNNGTFVRIATVSALTLTFTSNVAFTVAASDTSVVVNGQETDADYAFNLASEWSSFEDVRVTLTNTPLRATRPYDSAQTDQCTNGYLFSRAISEEIHIEPAKRKETPQGGGRVAGKLNGRVYQGLTRVLLDSATTTGAALATFPSRAVPLQTEADGRPGVYFTEARTMYGSNSQIKFMRMARLANEAKIIILAIQINEVFSGFPSDPSDPTKLSSKAIAAIEGAGQSALRRRFKGIISNADSIDDPEGPLFSIDPSTDLSTGFVLCNIFIRTLFYLSGFKTTISIKAPGQ